MAAVLNLAHILELVNDRLRYRTLTEQKAIHIAHQARLHPLTALGDQLHALCKEKFKQGLGDVALVPIDLAKEATQQLRHGLAIIDVSRRESHAQNLTLIVEDEVELEAKEPSSAALASLCLALEDLVLMDSSIVADD